MNEFMILPVSLPPTTLETIEKIQALEEKVRKAPQIEFVTEHVFHAGMYARTVRIGPQVVFTSVLIKRATILIVHGDLMVLMGNEMVRMSGYAVLPAEAGRKQVYITGSEVELTMIFPTTARTVEEAEEEFTDETENLLSHSNENDIVSTTCQE